MSIKVMTDVVDVVAGLVVVGALVEWLPPTAAFLSIIWLAIRIGEWARVVVWKRPKR